MSEQLPPSTRLIHAGFDYAAARKGRFWALAALLVLGVVLAQGIYVVKKEQLAVVTRFGEVIKEDVQPGWHYCLPIVDRAHIRKVERIEIHRIMTSENGLANFSVLSGDLNLLEISIAVQYRIDNLREFLFASTDPIEVTTMLVRDELVKILAINFIDLILTLNRNLIQDHMLAEVAMLLEEHNIGIEVLALDIVDVNPIEETRAAFRDVSDAVAERKQVISNANRERERLLARTRGQAEALLQDARARGHERVAQSGSAAEAFSALLRQYREQPSQTAITRYWQRMRSIFADASLAAVNPGDDSSIDINMIEGLADITGLGLDGAPQAGQRPLLTVGGEEQQHTLETVDQDRHLVSGRFHDPASERDDLVLGRTRSLIFDRAAIFTHTHAQRNAPPVENQPVTKPMVEVVEEEAAAEAEEGGQHGG